ncbi:MAG: DUF4384 domain-containing protein [Pyrinomonadaceae bacterium]
MLIAMFCFVSSSVAQQKKQVGGGTGKLENTRGLGLAAGEEIRQSFQRRQSDGMKLAVYSLNNRKYVPVDPGQKFKEGDRIKIKFESNFDGHVYVINVTPSGERRFLFPFPSKNNRVRAGQSYDIPRSGEYAFDDEKGVEVIQVVMSRSQIALLDTALDLCLKNSSNVLDASTVKFIEILTGKASREKRGGVFTYGAEGRGRARKQDQTIRQRGLSLAKGKDDTILTLSHPQGVPSVLKPGEASIFEVRLNHN